MYNCTPRDIDGANSKTTQTRGIIALHNIREDLLKNICAVVRSSDMPMPFLADAMAGYHV